MKPQNENYYYVISPKKGRKSMWCSKCVHFRLSRCICYSSFGCNLWILLSVVDIRDVAGNLLHGDYAFAGLSAIGLLPYAGDGAKACGKVVKFVIKNVDNLPMLMNLFKPLLKNSPELVANLGKSDEFAVMVESLA